MIQIVGRDLFMNAWGFALLLMFLMLAFIRDPQPPTTEAVKPPGNMMVCAFWEGQNDIDLWPKSPDDDKAVGYSRKNGNSFDLVRDDLGTPGDGTPSNVECSFARQTPDGRWVVNLHGYKVSGPVPVHVEVRMSGDYGFKLILQSDLVVKQNQEITVAQFRLADGKVVSGSLNRVHVPLREGSK